MRKIFFFFFFAAMQLSLPTLYKELTHGFRLSKLYIAPGQPATVSVDYKELFDQPFHYLGKGMQFFVFESEDKKIVIKLFKKPPKNSCIDRIEKTFEACRLAFSLAREETGLLFIHLSKTSNELPILQMKNRLGLSFSLPLDSYSFVIQKKAEPFFDTLLQALQKNEAGPLIDSYLALIASRASKGICNTDLLLKNNFGFLGSEALEIDFGNYLYAPEQKSQEFRLFANRLRRFLKKNAPDYLPIYDQKVSELS